MKIHYQSPIGTIEIEETDNFITALRFVEKDHSTESTANPILLEAIQQLKDYFAGKRTNFDLPLKQVGTDFQQRAWDYLLTIPYGETISYKDEAIGIGSPKGCRAVGSANGKNNIAIIVPCHRVINEDGKLGGYAYGLDTKRHLLDMERLYKTTVKDIQ